VAGNYNRTIEFTAKDAQIKRAVEKLAKSLTAIDKIVDKINGKFVKNLKGSIGDISKELKNTVKVATDLGKVFSDNAKKAKRVTAEMQRQAMIAKVQTKNETKQMKELWGAYNSLQKGKGIRVSSKARGSAAFGGGLRGKGEAALSSTQNAALLEAQQKLKSFLTQVGQAQTVFAKNEQGLERQAAGFRRLASSIDLSKEAISQQTEEYKLFQNATRGQAIAEQNLLKIEKERINIKKQLLLGQGLAPAAEKFGTYDTAETLLAKSDEAIGNTLAEVNLYKSQLEDAVQFIEIGTELWDRTNSKIEDINTSLGKNTETTRRIKKEEKERTNELKAQRKILDDITKRDTQRVKKGVMELFGVMGGKRGPLPQLASINLLSNGIQKLIRFVPFLDQKLKAQVRNWAEVGKVATKVLGGITLASGVLTKTLGATTWVADAIKGFIQFEDVASKVIWSIEGQMSKAFSLFGRLARELPNIASAAMMVMPEALGGAGLPMGDAAGFFSKGSAYNELAAKVQSLMSGRNESRRYGRQGPTDLQKDQRRLEWYNKLLSQRNRTADDYVTILNKAAQVERNISRETKIQADLRARSNGELAKQRRIRQAEIRRARQQKRRERSTGYFNAFDDRAEAFEFQRAEQQAQIYMRKDVQSMMTGIDPNEDRRVTRGAWERLQRRRSNRRQMNARTREGLMLGAGFPILFGGGLGSVAGGVGGALAQSKMGPGAGFGAQILLSALGQSIDAFVVKTAEMGKALGDFTKDTGALTEALGLAGTAEGQRIKNIQAAEGEQAAFDATVKRLTATIGEVGVQRLKDFGEQWTDLMMQMQAGLLRVQSATAGVLLWFDKFLALSGRAKQERILTFARESDDAKIQAAVAQFDKVGGANSGGTVRQKLLQPVLEAATPAFNKMMEEAKEGKLYAGSKLESTDKEIERLERIFQMKSGDREALERTLEIEREVEGVQSGQVDKLKEKLRYKKELEDANEVLKKQEEELKAVYDAIGVSIRDGLVEGINAAIDGTKTLGEVASNTFRRISNALLNYGVNLGLSALPGGLGTFFQGALGMAGTPTTPVKPNFGNAPLGPLGNPLSQHTNMNVGERATGGPVSGGSPYIVGEKGPELFVPGSSGNVVPNNAMGGTNVVVNVDASGSSVEGDEADSRELGNMLAAAIQAELIRQKRPGGLLV
tara:strand:+ start:502 stop:4035 length:3534 start_codon:yes stop_codon:yes gene_type:complete